MTQRPTVQARRPARDIALAATAKLILLAILYGLFFAPSNRPIIDDDAVSHHLLDATGGAAP